MSLEELRKISKENYRKTIKDQYITLRGIISGFENIDVDALHRINEAERSSLYYLDTQFDLDFNKALGIEK